MSFFFIYNIELHWENSCFTCKYIVEAVFEEDMPWELL